MASNRIAELSSIIGSNTTEINDYLSSKGLPAPSFEPDVPPSFVQEKSIAACRQAILEATDELHALMLGPLGILTTPPVRLTVEVKPSLETDCEAECNEGIPSTITLPAFRPSINSSLPQAFPITKTKHLIVKYLKHAG